MSSGALAVVRFNWPFYLLAGAISTLGGLLLVVSHRPELRFAASAALAVALYFAVASLLASYIVYDRSGITNWTWLRDVIPADASAIANINAGFDDTSERIRLLFGHSTVKTFVFARTGGRTESSIVRARRLRPTDASPAFDPKALPVPPRSQDAILLLFAVHEIRDAGERRTFFHALATSLRPGGVLVVVEHLRDLANTLVYGPGALHFYGRAEWMRLGNQTGMQLVAEKRLTPFVRAFIWRAPANDGASR